jgi:hypothetical protein
MSLLLQALIALPLASDTVAVDFSEEVLPILKARCIECHQDPAKNSGKRPKGGLRLDGKHWILKGTRSGPVVIAGAPQESTLIELIALDENDPDLMPPKGGKLTPTEVDTLSRWVAEGASFGDWVGAPAPGEASPDELKPTTKPSGKLPRSVLLYMALGEGLNPHTEEQIKLAEGERGTIKPVFPGSPLLAVGFPSNQGRTGTADVRGLMCCAENVATLDLGRTRITDEALSTVANMPRLVKLDLRQTNVTDEGLKHLAGLQNLRSLNLFKVNITDESIELLSGLKKLETVYLWQSKVSPAGAQRIRDRRPELRVVYEAILPPPERPSPDDDGQRRRR